MDQQSDDMSNEKKNSHTPGPWTVKIGRYPNGSVFGYGVQAEGKIPFVANAGMAEPDHITALGDEDLKFVPTAFSRSEVEANGYLIAAAPELLDALKYARRFLNERDHDTAYIDGILAKATGAAK